MKPITGLDDVERKLIGDAIDSGDKARVFRMMDAVVQDIWSDTYAETSIKVVNEKNKEISTLIACIALLLVFSLAVTVTAIILIVT